MSRKTRKLMWSVPLIAAVAVIGVLAAFVVLGTNGAQAHAPLEDHGLPGPVTGLEATAESRSSIELEWNAPTKGATPTGYRIDYSSDNRTWNRLLDENDQEVRVGHPATDLLITWGVTPKTRFHYRVFAYNDVGDGPVGNTPVTAFVDVTDDGHPALAPSTVGFELTVKASGPNKLVLSWTEPEARGAAVTAYKIVEMLEQTGDANLPALECTTPDATDGDCLLIASQTARTAEHDGLNAGSAHYYRVIAISTAGDTATDIEGATTARATSPGVPQHPVAVPLAARDVELYWNKPSRTGGVSTLNYEIQGRYRATDDVAWPPTWTDITTSTSDPGRSDGTTMTAYNASLMDPTAGQWQFRVRTVQGGDIDARQLKSSWVQFNTRAAQTIVVPDPAPMSDTNVPLAPTVAANARDADTADDEGVNVTWVPSDGDDDSADDDGPQPDSWRLDYSDDGTVWSSLELQMPFADHVDGFKDYAAPTTGGPRYYRVIPINGHYRGQAGQESATADAAPTDPDAVQVFTLDAEGISSTVIQLTWPEVSTAVDYNIYYADVDEESGLPADSADDTDSDIWATRKEGHTSTTYDHDGLDPGDEFWYRVVPQDALGGVTGTGAVEARGQTKIDEEPGSPWNLAAEDAQNSNFRYTSRRGVLLLWDAPDEEGKASPTGYQIERQVDGGSWEELKDDTGSTNTHFTDEENLMDGEWRVYRVAAVSGETTGPWSNEAAIGHTMAAAASTLDATPAGAAQIDLSWTITPPATVPASVINRIDDYIIERAYGDVMFLDDERTDDDAFTDAESWWNGLECAGMVAAVNDDGAAVSSNPFCKMYDGLADADETTVDEYFAKRYAIIDNDFALPPMMSYMDMNLMVDTEYSYRLRAVYQLGVSDWSETAMATAVQVPPSTELTAPSDVMATVGRRLTPVPLR